MAYCTRADIEALFGAANVKLWADLDAQGDETTIEANITRQITDTDAWVNDFLRNGPYTLPVASSLGVTPPTLVSIVATLAGCSLYGARGIRDANPRAAGEQAERFRLRREEAESRLRQVRSGAIVLDAVRAESAVPHVVLDRRSRHHPHHHYDGSHHDHVRLRPRLG